MIKHELRRSRSSLLKSYDFSLWAALPPVQCPFLARTGRAIDFDIVLVDRCGIESLPLVAPIEFDS